MRSSMMHFRSLILLVLISAGLQGSDRFGYTITIPKKRTLIVMTCKDSDAGITRDSGFKTLAKPLGGIVIGMLDEFPEDKSYLVFMRREKGRIYCHVDEEPVGEKPVVKEFSFKSSEWKTRFLTKVFQGILNRKTITSRSTKLEKKVEGDDTQKVVIELGPVPGQSSESWAIH